MSVLFNNVFNVINSRGCYSDGKLKAPVKPCAGNVGTQIMVSVCVFVCTKEQTCCKYSF